jgi:ABC-2 type transport system permease protein
MENRLKKYWQAFKISWQNSFVYRLNFMMWRVRNVLGLVALYSLFSAIFQTKEIFGWQLSKILTYILLSSLLQSIVFSSRTIDLAWKINRGEINNFLLKPISIFKFTFSIDAADKLLNLIFSFAEVCLLIFFLKPSLVLSFNLVYFFLFSLAILLATVLYFFINFLMGTIGFWTPEVWAPRFIFNIVLGFAAGAYFPLDFLPKPLYLFLKLTPFHYLIFFPLQLYLGQVKPAEIVQAFLVLLIWVFILFYFVRYIWQKGIKSYEAQGI